MLKTANNKIAGWWA